MYRLSWRNHNWENPRIVPYGPVPIEPASLGLQLGQSAFEGLKAYRGTTDGVIRLFRPERNANRFRISCDRLCIPPITNNQFLNGIHQLVSLDQEWVPYNRNQALYIRPFVFGLDSNLSLIPADQYELFIMTSPVPEYFDPSHPGLSLKAEDQFTRASRGGTGYAKTAGNYAATLRPTKDAIDEGFDQILWLDAHEHQFIEEAGLMNIFFYLDNAIVTPRLTGTILAGITRESVLTLARDWSMTVEERDISIQQIIEASNQGKLREVFGVGTGAVIAPIRHIRYMEHDIFITNTSNDSFANKIRRALTGIQYGEKEDHHNWMVPID